MLEATLSQDKRGSSDRVPIAGQELFRACYEEMDPDRSEVAGLAAPDEFASTLLVIDALARSCKAVRMWVRVSTRHGQDVLLAIQVGERVPCRLAGLRSSSRVLQNLEVRVVAQAPVTALPGVGGAVGGALICQAIESAIVHAIAVKRPAAVQVARVQRVVVCVVVGRRGKERAWQRGRPGLVLSRGLSGPWTRRRVRATTPKRRAACTQEEDGRARSSLRSCVGQITGARWRPCRYRWRRQGPVSMRNHSVEQANERAGRGKRKPHIMRARNRGRRNDRRSRWPQCPRSGGRRSRYLGIPRRGAVADTAGYVCAAGSVRMSYLKRPTRSPHVRVAGGRARRSDGAKRADMRGSV